MDDDWYWGKREWDRLPLWAVRGLWWDESDWPPLWMENPLPETEQGEKSD